jgi:hypothetical protein
VCTSDYVVGWHFFFVSLLFFPIEDEQPEMKHVPSRSIEPMLMLLAFLVGTIAPSALGQYGHVGV